MSDIQKDFDKKAFEYDDWICKVCPSYALAIDVVLSLCPRKTRYVLDLGCGTGTIGEAVCGKYPQAHVTLVDISPNMIARAREKLHHYAERTRFFEKDITRFRSQYTFDIVISSLAIHHLSLKKKEYLFEEVLKQLVPGGYFFIIEQVVGATSHCERVYRNKWVETMRAAGLRNAEIEEVLQRKEDHDQCLTVWEQLNMLKKTGFTGIDVFFKDYSIVVFGAQKY